MRKRSVQTLCSVLIFASYRCWIFFLEGCSHRKVLCCVQLFHMALSIGWKHQGQSNASMIVTPQVTLLVKPSVKQSSFLQYNKRHCGVWKPYSLQTSCKLWVCVFVQFALACPAGEIRQLSVWLPGANVWTTRIIQLLPLYPCKFGNLETLLLLMAFCLCVCLLLADSM